ncbi:MAG: M36 family metallopeptidase, partial [Betaproteobacteria bacterium]
MVRANDDLVPGNANFTGVYTIGSYVEDGPLIPGATQGYAGYYGLRRYPYSSDLAKNPLTFDNIKTFSNLPFNPPPRFSGDNAEVHATGEVWASMLWGCYSALLRDTPRLAFAEAQDRMKRYLVAAYKLTPVNPTLIEARDALFAAIGANDGADLSLCMAAFAQRGAGVGATSGDRYAEDNRGGTESFSTGAELSITGMAFIPPAVAGCNADSFLDLGETGTVAITIRNTGSVALAGATINLSGYGLDFPGGASSALPLLAPSMSTTVNRAVHLAQTPNPNHTIVATINTVPTAVDGPRSSSLKVLTGYDDSTVTSTVDNVEAAATVWTSILQGTTDNSLNWTRQAVSGTNHAWHGPGGGSAGVAWLTSPPIPLGDAANLELSFMYRHAFERSGSSYYDGGVIEISSDDGATWSDIGSLGTLYAGTISNDSGESNPLVGRVALVGISFGYPDFIPGSIPLPASYRGRTVRVRFGMATDNFGNYAGWDLDDIGISAAVPPFTVLTSVADNYSCVNLAPAGGNSQSAAVGTPYATPLTVRAMGGDGLPVSGVMIDFRAPGAGASASFSGFGGNFANSTTDNDGYASSPVFNANSIGGSYNIAAHLGPRIASFTATNLPAGTLPVLLGVKSRKQHGGAGLYDLVINTAADINGAITVEPRFIGAGHHLRFEFDRAVALPGILSVVDASMQPFGTAVASAYGNAVTVTLTGIPDGKRLLISLTDIDGTGVNASAAVGFLVGDANSSRRVVAADIIAARRRSRSIDSENFIVDVDLNGSVNALDIAAIKARSGNIIP